MARTTRHTGPYEQIAVDTRQGGPVDNQQRWELGNLDWSGFADIKKRWKANMGVQLLQDEPMPYYNCHGLTFASRRSSVTGDVKDIRSILFDDCFVEVKASEVRVGDVVIYDENSDISHSGIVVGFKEGLQSEQRFPRVWSKWGEAGPEAEHLVQSCPYISNTTRISYFRLGRCARQAKSKFEDSMKPEKSSTLQIQFRF
jgi:hypothetical protein